MVGIPTRINATIGMLIDPSCMDRKGGGLEFDTIGAWPSMKSNPGEGPSAIPDGNFPHQLKKRKNDVALAFQRTIKR